MASFSFLHCFLCYMDINLINKNIVVSCSVYTQLKHLNYRKQKRQKKKKDEKKKLEEEISRKVFNFAV